MGGAEKTNKRLSQLEECESDILLVRISYDEKMKRHECLNEEYS